jgi:hypothetical protein
MADKKWELQGGTKWNKCWTQNSETGTEMGSKFRCPELEPARLTVGCHSIRHCCSRKKRDASQTEEPVHVDLSTTQDHRPNMEAVSGIDYHDDEDPIIAYILKMVEDPLT